MPGFVAILNSKKQFAPSEEKNCIIEAKSSTNYFIERRTNKKFANDKFFYENDDYLFLLDGVILNNHTLMQKYDCDSWLSCVMHMHQINPLSFYNDFRGSFVGCVYDKRKESWLFYTDHIGDKQIFYYRLDDGGWLIGTEMIYMIDAIQANHQPITPNRDAAFMLMTLGYVIEDNTLVNEIHKLVAGHYLMLHDNNLQEVQYHRFNNTPVNRSKKEIIDELDLRFRNAVAMQFEKDKEYGYHHFATLSGGLDSRMTVWVAHQLGYTQQLNLTFSQSNYTDFYVAQQIATDLGHEFIFKALDGGNCLYLLENVTKLTCGLACYFGLSHTKSMLDNINYEPYGILHTGMLGDVIIGSYLKEPLYNRSLNISDGADSLVLIDKLRDYKFHNEYSNSEIYMMYNRGFGYCGQGTLSCDHCKTETLSPFCDVDFMEFCFSIPLELRCEHKIYFEWVMGKYPQAGLYVWEKKHKTIPELMVSRKTISLLGRELPAPSDPAFKEYIKGFILRRLGLRKKTSQLPKKSYKESVVRNNMNPIDYWYYYNNQLKRFLDAYWMANQHVLIDEEVFDSARYLYDEVDAAYDKLEVLSLLSAYKTIWNN